MQRFEVYEDIGGEWRWRLLAADEKIIASSGESFTSRSAALRAAQGVRATAPAATISIAPGLGIAAALRLRALLATPTAGRSRNTRRAGQRLAVNFAEV
jgi:uncharacterized protein YegP (UPF0339 family)